MKRIILASLAAMAFQNEILGQDIHLIARSGDAAPDTPGYLFSGFVLSNQGGYTTLPQPLFSGDTIGFFSSLKTTAGGAFSDDRSLWTYHNNQVIKLAHTRDPAPDTEAGTNFNGLVQLFSLKDGRFAFNGGVAGPSMPSYAASGTWLWNLDSIELLMRRGEYTPNTTPAVRFLSGLDVIGLDGTLGSDLAFYANAGKIFGLTEPPGTPSNTWGIWQRTPEDYELSAWSYGPTPGIPNHFRPVEYAFQISSSGRGAQWSRITGPSIQTVQYGVQSVTNDLVIWSTSLNESVVVARSGDMAPGVTDSAVFKNFTFSNDNKPAVHPVGDIVFAAGLAGPSVGTEASVNGRGLWRYADGELSLLLRGGDPIPEVSPQHSSGGGLYNSVETQTLAIRPNRNVVLTTYNQRPDVTLGNMTVLLERQPSGGGRLVTRAGVPQDFLPPGLVLSRVGFPNQLRVRGNDLLSFKSKLAGTGVNPANDEAIFLEDGANGIRMLAREGDNIDGYILKYFYGSNPGSDLQMNNAGDIAFQAGLVPASNPSQTPKKGIIWISRNSPARVLLAEGSTREFANGGSGLIQAIGNLQSDWLSETRKIVAPVVFSYGPKDEGLLLIDIPDATNPSECAADFNEDSALDTTDLFSFLSAFFSQHAAADFNGNGTIEVPDLFAYLSAYFAGC